MQGWPRVGCSSGMFCANYPYFLVLSWLPLFLVKQHGFSITAMAWIGAAVYVIAGVVNVLAGRLSDRALALGADITRTRKAALVAGGAIAVGCMALCALGGPEVAVAGLLLFSLSPGLMVFSTMSTGQTLAGPRAAGKWIGLQNGIGGLSGVVGPLLTGSSLSWVCRCCSDSARSPDLNAGIAGEPRPAPRGRCPPLVSGARAGALQALAP